MANYPAAVYSPRTKENKSGVVYDASKSTVGYAEDVTKLDDEVVAIETELGTNPKGGYANVKARLVADEAMIPMAATGPEIDTGTENGKMATPLAIADSSLVLAAKTQTLTNKRITARVQSVADAATITPNADNDDCVDITAIAQAFEIANPSGTPTNFQKLLIRIKDNGTARAITWGDGYVAGGVALPSTTVLSKILTLGFIYNTANALNKWQLVASAQEA